MKLLIVDDDQTQTERYGDIIEKFNHTAAVKIHPEYRHTAADGITALNEDYDGAVIDLKLSTSGAGPAEGNFLIREVRTRKRFPVCIFTGFVDDLDSDLRELLDDDKNPLFWLVKRDRGFEDVLNRLMSVHRSGLVSVIGPNGTIESALNTIFWTHLAKPLSFWNSRDGQGTDRQQRLLRFILMHLLQLMDVNENGSLDDCYPDEMYIIPTLRQALQTGNLVERQSDRVILLVLTPSCDLAQDKAKSIQLAEVEALSDGVMKSLVGSYRNLLSKPPFEDPSSAAARTHQVKLDKARQDLEKLVSNAYAGRYHFLPPAQGFKGGLVNFQKINSIPLKEFKEGFTSLGTITTAFLKDIVARFSSYYARQGQPNFEVGKLIESLLK